MKAIGRKITISDRLVASTASAISRVPFRAASIPSMPSSSMCRKMFSCTTTASSITMPMARIRPSIVMLLSVKPMYLMNTNVGMIDVGIASVAIRVVRQSRMNSRIVAETSTAARSRWNFTSSIDFLMNRDWSRMISVAMSGGSAALSCSSRALTSSTTLTVLTPDCFCTTRLTALSPSSRASVRGSSNKSSARPMSRMPDRIAVAVGDDQVVELGRRAEPAQGAQHQLARALVDPAARAPRGSAAPGPGARRRPTGCSRPACRYRPRRSSPGPGRRPG